MPRVKQSARRSVSGSSCAAASWAPDSDDDLAGDAARVSRLDKAERGAMGVALAELSRALDTEDWSVAVTVSDSALAKWPRWRELRAAKERLAGYLAACATTTSARRRPPPPTDLRLTDVDEASLPSARAARMPEHISRMGDVLPHVFSFLAREPDSEPLWTATPLIDKMIESSLRDVDGDLEKWGLTPRRHLEAPKKVRERLVLYQTVRGVSKAWCGQLYSNIRRLTISQDWCARLPPDAAERFVNLDSVVLWGSQGDCRVSPNGQLYYKVEAQFALDAQFSLPTMLRHLPKLRVLVLYNIQIQQFPSWFANLPVKELYVEFPTPSGYYAHPTPVPFEDESLLFPAWMIDETCLPRGLELLNFGEHMFGFDVSCVRRLTCLHEMRMSNIIRPACPEWLSEVASLRRIEIMYLQLAESVDVLRKCHLESIEFTMEPFGGPEATDGFLAGLERLVVGTPCGASLRELNLRSNLLGSVPNCFRGLQLQVLRIGETGITELPSWISELPLVVLDVSVNNLETLPSSLRTLTTLRVLDLQETGLSGPEVDLEEAEREVPYQDHMPWTNVETKLMIQRTNEYKKIGDCIEEVVRRDSELRALSRALPKLRLRLHTSPIQIDSGVDRYWWHERCDCDWLDPSFYTNSLCRPTSTDGLEAARSAIRAARANASAELTEAEVRGALQAAGGRMKTKDLLVRFKARLKANPANKDAIKRILRAVADVQDSSGVRVLVLKAE